jgi:type IV secretion system protein VirB5
VKNRLIIKQVFAVLLGHAETAAFGQIPVTVTSDVPATLNQIQTMAKWADQLVAMRNQFDKLNQQYEAMTGHYGRGVMGLAESINSSSVVPGSWQEVVAQQKGGGFGAIQKNIEDLIKTMPQDLFQNPKGQDAANYKLSTDAVRAALSGGQALYAQVQTNLNNLATMARQIDLTGNAKDAADLQNRIAAENGLLQSAMAKLNVMNMNLQANMLNQQNQAAAVNLQRYKHASP